MPRASPAAAAGPAGAVLELRAGARVFFVDLPCAAGWLARKIKEAGVVEIRAVSASEALTRWDGE